MRNHQTYSLTTILDKHTIKPQVYQQILHDIKSPLEEISIVMTNDNSVSFDKIPKRPNIPPPPIKSPIIHLIDHNFSRTHQSMDMTLKQSPRKTRQNFQDHIIESILSPLDQQITKKQQVQSNKSQQYKPFCGVFQSILYADKQLQIQLPVRTKIYKRKPIFNNNTQKNQSKPTKTISEAVIILKQINQPQIAAFLQLLNQLSQQLQFLSRYKQKLNNYLQIIYEKLSQNSDYLPENIEKTQTTSRVLRRLKTKNTTQVLAKVLKRKKWNKEADVAIQQLFTSLNHIQSIISKYLKDIPNSVDSLAETFDFLEHNFRNQNTLADQIKSFLSSLEISIFLQNLDIIWEKCEQRLLTRQEFIESITLNDLIVRSDKGFQQDLVSKGFCRNQ